MARVDVRALPTVVALLAAAACSDGTAPQAGPPARIEVTSGATFAGTVATPLATPLAIRVVDEQGRAVQGAVVRFSLLIGGGSLEPLSATSGSRGEAATTLTFGPASGGYEIVANVTGVQFPGRFTGSAAPGEVARVVVTPGQVRMSAVGDSSRFRARQYDAHGNVVPGGSIVWRAADGDVVTVQQNGVVRGARAPAIGRVIASVDDRADTAFVVIADPTVSRCLGYSPPVSLAVGQALEVSMTDGACITSAGDEEYVIVPWHGSTAGAATATLQIIGSGLAPVTTSQSVAPSVAARPHMASGDPERSFALEARIREMGRRDVMPLARRARDAVADRLVPSYNRRGAIPTNVALGEFLELNANASASCSAPSMRTGRVVAVSSRAVVVHDTANPAGGFTDTDYQRFAVTFDTLIAPVNDAAFGAPTDIDRNAKVVIFFTRAVNELTPVGASFYYGGFFHPRDLLPRLQNGAAFCEGSNEGEMFYMLVPDPDGQVNGNRRRIGFVDSVTIGTLAHEYQHLVNAGRRAHVNDATTDEEAWLNEGLSHIAEELVFYRAAGRSPRQNLGGAQFGTQPYDGLFSEFLAPNIGRLRVFLLNTHNYSPYTPGDELATRGAVWAFLRYLADRRGVGDGDVWLRLVNTRTAGLANLREVFGPDVLAMLRDWTISLYTDDYVVGVGSAHSQPSWNFRTVFPAMPGSPRSYPLAEGVRTLVDDGIQTVVLNGGSGAFLRFSVAAGRDAAIRVTSNGFAPPATVRATIVRRR